MKRSDSSMTSASDGRDRNDLLQPYWDAVRKESYPSGLSRLQHQLETRERPAPVRRIRPPLQWAAGLAGMLLLVGAGSWPVQHTETIGYFLRGHAPVTAPAVMQDGLSALDLPEAHALSVSRTDTSTSFALFLPAEAGPDLADWRERVEHQTHPSQLYVQVVRVTLERALFAQLLNAFDVDIQLGGPSGTDLTARVLAQIDPLLSPDDPPTHAPSPTLYITIETLND